MLELLALGLAGLLAGAALGAARSTAPRPLRRTLWVMSAVALLLAVALLVAGPGNG